MSQYIISGARCRFFLGGQPMGWGQGVTISEEISQEPAHVLDMLEAAEHVPVAYTVQLQVQLFKVPTKDLVMANLWPSSAPTPELRRRFIIDFPEMSAEIYDSHLNIPVAKIYRIKPRSRSVQYQARGIVSTNAQFVAIHFADEGTTD